MTTTTLPRCAVIGAGSSGIAMAKALHDRGADFVVYEASDRIGGNWVFGNTNGTSAAYRGLHINTSREVMEYRDLPMPKSYPDFPHHTHIAEYFDSYVDHFGFRDHIRFQTRVEHVDRDAEGVWTVRDDQAATERFDFLFVANGHHWDARWPEPAFPGSDDFEGVQLHAHSYTEDTLFRDKDVVVLGMGNSAMDLAVESSYVAKSTYLAARRGVWIVPKYLDGRPMDQPRLNVLLNPRIPLRVRHAIGQRVLMARVGDLTRYGLPAPDHRFGQAHPTVSGRILDRLGHGMITPKPNIERLEGDQVVFTDGSSVHADVVVYCTGYKITFPFLDEDLVAAPDNHIELFQKVMHPDFANLAFVGLVQPWGAVMPLAEAQAKWLVDYVEGAYALPSREEMRGAVRKDADAMAKRYVASKRHTIQVDAQDYLLALERERADGGERARAQGYRRPVASLAAAGVGA